LKKVYARIQEFEKQHGKLWAPAPLLKKLAEEGRTFADFDKRVGDTAASVAEARS
jgi:3-hydroxyacyl-CoA dehydrogenase